MLHSAHTYRCRSYLNEMDSRLRSEERSPVQCSYEVGGSGVSKLMAACGNPSAPPVSFGRESSARSRYSSSHASKNIPATNWSGKERPCRPSALPYPTCGWLSAISSIGLGVPGKHMSRSFLFLKLTPKCCRRIASVHSFTAEITMCSKRSGLNPQSDLLHCSWSIDLAFEHQCCCSQPVIGPGAGDEAPITTPNTSCGTGVTDSTRPGENVERVDGFLVRLKVHHTASVCRFYRSLQR